MGIFILLYRSARTHIPPPVVFCRTLINIRWVVRGGGDRHDMSTSVVCSDRIGTRTRALYIYRYVVVTPLGRLLLLLLSLYTISYYIIHTEAASVSYMYVCIIIIIIIITIRRILYCRTRY